MSDIQPEAVIMGKFNFVLGVTFMLLLVLLPVVSASTLSIDHNDPLINETLRINRTFSGGHEAERLINWSKSSVYQGFIVPPTVSIWGVFDGWFNSSNIIDVSGADNGNDGVYNNAPIPILLLNLDEGTGTNAEDTSGQGNNGTLVNGATWGTGISGNAVEFDGVNQYVNLSNANSLRVSNGYTFSLWLKTDDMSTSRVLSKYEGWKKGGYDLYFSTNYLEFYTQNATDVKAIRSQDITGLKGEWFHVLITCDNGVGGMYINGVEGAVLNSCYNEPYYDYIDSNLYLARVGDGSAGGFYNGSIDEVEIYNESLTQTQITNLYNSQKALFNPQYDLSDGSIDFDGVDDSITISDDSSIDNIQSISFWINLTRQNDNYNRILIDKKLSYYPGLTIKGANQQIWFYPTSGESADIRYEDWENWHHIVLTITNNSGVNESRIYYDGNIMEWLASGSTTFNISTLHPFDNAENLYLMGGTANRWVNGSIKDVRIYNYSLTPSQVKMVYNNSEWLTEGNFTIMDNLTFRARSYNGTGWTAEATANEDYTVAITQSYASAIFEGEKANYEFNITKGDNVLSTTSFLYYNTTEEWTPTKTTGLIDEYTYQNIFGLIGDGVKSIVWKYNLTSIEGVYSGNLSANQTINSLLLTACGDSSNSTTLIWGMYHEDDLALLSTPDINGYITYWNPDNSATTRTFAFGDLNVSAGYTLGSTDSRDTGGGSSTSAGTIDTKFNVYEQSIITAITGSGTGATCDDVTVTIYQGECGSATTLYTTTVNATTAKYWGIALGLDNFTTPLQPGTDYCIRYTDAGCTSYVSGLSSYSGSIFSYSSQYTISDQYLTFRTAVSDGIALCLSNTTATINADGYIQYNGTYKHRYYMLNQSLNGSITSIFLYNYNTTTDKSTLDAQTVTSAYVGYPNLYVKLMRYYPSENLYRLVQMDKSDEFGKSYFHVKEEEDYKFIIQDYTTILKTTNALKFYCPTVDDCIVKIVVSETPSSFAEFTDYTTSYDETTRIFTLIYNDVTGDTDGVTVTAVSHEDNGTRLWCNTSATGATGTLTCNLTGIEGIVYINAYRTASPEKPFYMQIIELIKSGLYDILNGEGLGNEGFFWAGILAIIIVFAGAMNPLTLIISTPLALVLVYALGMVNFINLTFIVLAVIMALVLGTLIGGRRG